MKRQQRLRAEIAAESIACVACLGLLIWTALVMPDLETAVRDSADAYYGGMLLSSPALGYVVIGVLGFLSGICITLLCNHLHKRSREGDQPW